MQVGTIPEKGTYLGLFDRVELRPSDTPKRGSINVQTIWKNVDRPDGRPFCIRAQDRLLAERLKALIERGEGYGEAVVLTDNTGQTYVSATRRFCIATLKRDINAMEQEALIAT